MLTLLSECHFWTTRNEIRIKGSDFSAFKYCTKRDLDIKNLSIRGKKEYSEKRDGIILLNNKKPGRLKDNVKKLEELLRGHKIVHTEWRDIPIVQILMSNGILVHICVNIFTGDIQKMAFDKYFVGKLAADTITDAIFTRQHILLAYNINQVTIVYLQKPNMNRYCPEKISNMEPKIFHIIISGPSERKLSRNLVINSTEDLLIVWTKSSQNEVYPWRPTIRDQDRANVHAYKLKSAKLESCGFCWTEYDPFCVEFLKASENQIITVEQKISRKGEITAEICSYEVVQTKMQRTTVASIIIGTQLCCYSFSPDQEKLLLGTIDRFICLHDLHKNTTKFAPKTDIIPTHCAWHPDSGIIMIANDRGQFQCFDISLSFIANQLTSEDVTPSGLLDLSHYFSIQPNLLNVLFSRKPNIQSSNDLYVQTDCYLLLIFENGPIGCLRFFSGAGMTGDVHNSGLTPDVLINKYLIVNQLEKAVNIFTALNWETYGAMCLISLHKIANYVLNRNDVKRTRNDLLGKAFKSFKLDLNEETREEFEDQVIDMKRRFFFFLLRHNLYMEAIEVARDINDYDLFMDLYNITKCDPNLHDISREAFCQAEIILTQNERLARDHSGECESLSSVCSRSSCSECTKDARIATTRSHDKKEERKRSIVIENHNTIKNNFHKRHEDNSNKLKNYVPPLPYLKSPIFNAENIKINIPKPELKLEINDNNNGYLNSARTRDKAWNRGTIDSNRHKMNTNKDNYGGNYYVNGLQIPTFSQFDPKTLFRSVNTKKEEYYSPTRSAYSTSVNTKYDEVDFRANIPDQTIGIPVVGTHSMSIKTTPANCNPLQDKTFSSTMSVNKNPYFSSQESSFHPPKFYQHPLVLGNIPAATSNSSGALSLPVSSRIFHDPTSNRFSKKPAASILSNSSSSPFGGNTGSLINSSPSSQMGNTHSSIGKKDSGEQKNKVKFSDTVQVAVVPEIPRKEKPLPPKRNGLRSTLTDPRKELADSLPLCHPNDEYLKDFNPLSEPNMNLKSSEQMTDPSTSNNKNPPTIKVVHFGVV